MPNTRLTYFQSGKQMAGLSNFSINCCLPTVLHYLNHLFHEKKKTLFAKNLVTNISVTD